METRNTDVLFLSRNPLQIKFYSDFQYLILEPTIKQITYNLGKLHIIMQPYALVEREVNILNKSMVGGEHLPSPPPACLFHMPCGTFNISLQLCSGSQLVGYNYAILLGSPNASSTYLCVTFSAAMDVRCQQETILCTYQLDRELLRVKHTPAEPPFSARGCFQIDLDDFYITYYQSSEKLSFAIRRI